MSYGLLQMVFGTVCSKLDDTIADCFGPKIFIE